jgi:hypothetical protein
VFTVGVVVVEVCLVVVGLTVVVIGLLPVVVTGLLPVVVIVLLPVVVLIVVSCNLAVEANKATTKIEYEMFILFFYSFSVYFE